MGILGVILVVVFNPLSVQIWADIIIEVLNMIADGLTTISDKTVLVGATLIVVWAFLKYGEYKAREATNLKKVAKKNKGKKSENYL